MNRRQLITQGASLALLCTTAAGAAAQTTLPAPSPSARTLAFEAHQGGQHTLLHLRIEAGQASGSLNEGAIALQLRGRLQGRRLQAQLFMAGRAQAVATLDGELQADQLELSVRAAEGGAPAQLLMRRVGAPAPAAPAGATLAPELFGAWQRQTLTNSGGGAGGFASFTTVRRLLVGADGRVQQTLRSVGGGGGWSHRSGEELEFSGRWQTRGSEVWVLADGEPAYVNVGRYRLVDGRLVIENAGGRQVWSR